MARIARSRLPVIVGPWTGEVGFELLYWIPFLQWVRETFPIDPARMIVISRGGVASWYGTWRASTRTSSRKRPRHSAAHRDAQEAAAHRRLRPPRWCSA
jgi:hypothetical protein